MKFVTRHICAEAVRLAYAAGGQDQRPDGNLRPLVFLHGWADCKAIWHRSLDYFSSRYPCVAFDLPGFGESDKPDGCYTPVEMASVVAGGIQGLGLGPATVVGHSLGGIVALALTLEHPEVVYRLALVNPANSGQFPRAIHRLYTRPYGPAALGVLRTVERALGQLAPDRGGGALGAYLRRARWTAMAPRRTLAETLGGVLRTDLRGRLGEVRVPTLIIAGDRDRTTPPAGAGEMAAAIPGAELVILRRVGHHPMDERPQEFMETLRAWLNRN